MRAGLAGDRSRCGLAAPQQPRAHLDEQPQGTCVPLSGVWLRIVPPGRIQPSQSGAGAELSPHGAAQDGEGALLTLRYKSGRGRVWSGAL